VGPTKLLKATWFSLFSFVSSFNLVTTVFSDRMNAPSGDLSNIEKLSVGHMGLCNTTNLQILNDKSSL
jgi:hypothetical protein